MRSEVRSVEPSSMTRTSMSSSEPVHDRHSTGMEADPTWARRHIKASGSYEEREEVPCDSA